MEKYEKERSVRYIEVPLLNGDELEFVLMRKSSIGVVGVLIFAVLVFCFMLAWIFS